MAVFSSSTTIASMFLPRITATANSYFLWVGLHKSTTRPRTPFKNVSHTVGDRRSGRYQGKFLTSWLGFPWVLLLFQIPADRHSLGGAGDISRRASHLSRSRVGCEGLRWARTIFWNAKHTWFAHARIAASQTLFLSFPDQHSRPWFSLSAKRGSELGGRF